MLKQQTKLRVRLYACLSKDNGDTDKESNSITNQLQMLRYNAKEKGFIAFCTGQGACRNCSDTEVRMSLYLQHRSLL